MTKNLQKKFYEFVLMFPYSAKALMIGITFMLASASAVATDYYVAPAIGTSPVGNDSNSGTSPSSPWTITKGVNHALNPGDVVHIRGGNYGHIELIVPASGTSSAPIKFEGYNGLPVLRGGDHKDTAFYIYQKSYIEVRNIKVAKYHTGVFAYKSNHITFDNLKADSCANTAADKTWDGYGLRFRGTTNSIIKNCVATDNGGGNITMVEGSNKCIIEYCSAISNADLSYKLYLTDYNINMGWSDSCIIRYCYAEFVSGADQGTHGIGIKDTQSVEGFEHSDGNYIHDNTAKNYEECFYAAHGAFNNIFERCYGDNTGKQGSFNHVLVARDGADNNQFISCVAIGKTSTANVYDGVENSDNYQDNNSFTNCIFKGGTSTTFGVFMRNARNTTFKNCTFDNLLCLFRFSNTLGSCSTEANSNIVLRNCIVSDVTNEYDATSRTGNFSCSGSKTYEAGHDNMSDVSATYTDFYNGFDALSGTGNFDSDPYFASGSDYHLKSQYGRWYDSTWVYDAVTSPCINAGYQNDPCPNEPVETGGPARIDVGAYGNTPEASKKYPSGNQAPTAVINSITPNPAKEGVSVSFSGTGTDSDGTITAYEWKSDDTVFSTSEDPSYSGLSVGTHTISFRVKDNNDVWSGYDTETLVINSNQAPTAVINSISPNPADYGTTVSFSGTGTDSDGTITAYEWKSDDTVFSTSEDPGYSGLSAGTHTISFRVKDNNNAWSSYDTETLVINSAAYPDMLGYWGFNESTGSTAYDSTVCANNGTISGATHVVGKKSMALNFNSNYVEIPSSASLNTITNGITISAWVYANANTASSNIIERWMYGTGVNQRAYCMYISSSGTISFGLSKDGTSTAPNYKWLTTTATITRNVWTHIAGTFDGTTMKIYINGDSSKSVAAGFSTIFVPTGDVHIGYWEAPSGTWSNPFLGKIDEVKLYKKALSTSEISAIYNNPPNLIADWKFNENTGTTATDNSGNINTGTLTNSPAWVTGRIGSALNFTTNYNYVNVSSSTSLNTITSGITLTGWVSAGSSTLSSNIIERWMYGTNINQRAYCLYITSSGAISFGLSTNGKSGIGNATWLTTTETISRNNEWKYITATFDGTTMKIYINGSLSTSVAAGFTTIFVPTGNVHIGCWEAPSGTFSNPFVGKIDEVKVYNRAFSLSEIQALYALTKSAYISEEQQFAVETRNNVLVPKCYPNPFSSELTISYFVPEYGRVTIGIYNLYGQLVNTIVDKNQAAGDYSVAWNAGKSANGLYICKVFINGKTATSKIMLKR